VNDKVKGVKDKQTITLDQFFAAIKGSFDEATMFLPTFHRTFSCVLLLAGVKVLDHVNFKVKREGVYRDIQVTSSAYGFSMQQVAIWKNRVMGTASGRF